MIFLVVLALCIYFHFTDSELTKRDRVYFLLSLFPSVMLASRNSLLGSLLLFLITQTISDRKFKMVYTNLNYFTLMIGFIVYLRFIFSTENRVLHLVYGGCIIFLLSLGCIFQFYGSGDAKGLIVVYFILSAVFQKEDIYQNAMPFVVLVLCSNLYFLFLCLFNKVKCFVKKQTTPKRIAYFPAITMGYLSVLVCYYFEIF